jgi:hypothetical protein
LGRKRGTYLPDKWREAMRKMKHVPKA